VEQFPSHNHVLEQLLVEGTFDRDGMSARIVVGMQYSAALCQQLLLQVEQLEEGVHGPDGLVSSWF
jgi:hypothetical protein